MSITIKRPVERKKLSERVEEELEDMIRQGEFAVGDALPSERDLMTAFGVGRPSIRDALSSLSRKGLVKISSGERTRVARPSADIIIAELSGMSKDFLSQPDGTRYFDQLRQFFESSLIRYAAEYATDEQIKELEHALSLNHKAIDINAQFKKTDINFHRIIATIPGNPIFLAIHQALVDWVIDIRPERADSKGLNLKSYEDHAAIVERIKAHDVEGADSVLMQHLQKAYDLSSSK
ncbi:transcriptional regulator NanR [Shewanella sp. D64]|uniref:transcriptional regulator NanR n=1 Tax=unclassified Shewanella TaxID=196818 RepID=UPI0022BA2A8F|nr:MULTISPECIES: transcriptional regulator NanR [unclassified Shewanella]MEC4727981.1 transcriptional regulator NanR [Shewanella sp. D64]MEC4740047.1 transcriptional regulator NanR [Shewanella sp. E94]WBJ95817.1 transcriptional regulator NanR [Shewanella sp. MTB7]